MTSLGVLQEVHSARPDIEGSRCTSWRTPAFIAATESLAISGNQNINEWEAPQWISHSNTIRASHHN